ncbi:Boron transporter 4 [Bienertia sinuspersici]
MRRPLEGVKDDVKGRLACYKQDWVGGIKSGFGILAPSTFVFFASALPVIAFGEQLSRDTDGSLSTVETLAATAICGIIQSLVGGQPLLILGVAEPTVIMYSYLYNFAKGRKDLGKELVCVWTSLMLILLAVFNVAAIINRFTRVAGELFGMLITVLFIQEAVKGAVSEFGIPKAEDPNEEKFRFEWRYINGLLGIIFTFGVLYTALKSRRARAWRYGTSHFRSFIADYGVPLMVVVWTALSFSVPKGTPEGVPRKLFSPLAWESASLYHWTVVKLMRRKMVESAKESIKKNASNTEIYGQMQEVFIEMDQIAKELQELKQAVLKGDNKESENNKFRLDHIDAYLPVRVNEQRVSNLLQSLLVAGALFIMPVIKLIPTSVLWGYFAVLEDAHASYVESVPAKYIAAFTLFQFVYLLICFGITWIPIAGILFPLPFFLLIVIRQYVLPKMFHPFHLHELDAAEYEEIAGAPRRSLSLSSRMEVPQDDVIEDDAEILDELTTNRGELKLRTSSFDHPHVHRQEIVHPTE